MSAPALVASGIFALVWVVGVPWSWYLAGKREGWSEALAWVEGQRAAVDPRGDEHIRITARAIAVARRSRDPKEPA